jgi:hypothetical protein
MYIKKNGGVNTFLALRTSFGGRFSKKMKGYMSVSKYTQNKPKIHVIFLSAEYFNDIF